MSWPGCRPLLAVACVVLASLVLGAAQARSQGAVVVRGSSVTRLELPGLIALPDGNLLDGDELTIGFLALHFGGDDLLAYDVGTKAYEVLTPERKAALTSTGGVLFHEPSGAPILEATQELEELLASRTTVVVFNVPSTTGGGKPPNGGDPCDAASNPEQPDSDGDGRIDSCDNCPTRANADQTDSNGDGLGDACLVDVAWLSPTSSPDTWSVTSGSLTTEDTIAFAGPTALFSNACLASQSLGGELVVVVDEVNFVVELRFDPPAPQTCESVSDPVAGLAGEIGMLAEGQWTFRSTSLGFSVSISVGPALINHVENGSFDVDVSGWTPDFNAIVEWDPFDIDQSPSSGAALVSNQSGQGGGYGFTQCIDTIVAGGSYDFSVSTYIEANQPDFTQIQHRIWFFPEPDCSGSTLLYHQEFIGSGETGQWVERSETDLVAPASTQSVFLRSMIFKNAEAPEAVIAYFDEVVFAPEPSAVLMQAAVLFLMVLIGIARRRSHAQVRTDAGN